MSVDPPNRRPKGLLFLSSLFLNPERPDCRDTPRVRLARRQHCQGSLTSELSFPAEGAESAGWPYNIKSQIRFWRMAPESSPCNTIWHILIVAGRWQDAGKLRWIDESVHCTSAPCCCKYYLVNAAAEQLSCSCSSGVCWNGRVATRKLMGGGWFGTWTLVWSDVCSKMFHAGPFQSDRARPKCTGRQKGWRPVECNPEMAGNAQATWGRIRQE